MKRSKSIGLITMGISVIALTACDEPKVEALVFDDLQQCLADKDLTREQCESNYNAAREQHAAVAPKYASQAECEAEFGAEKCEQAPQRTESGGSIFMPLMMGYMMGSMMNRGAVAPHVPERDARRSERGEAERGRLPDATRAAGDEHRRTLESTACARGHARLASPAE